MDVAGAVLRERTRLARFIRGRVSNPADADDILQDVLFDFFEAYHLPAPVEQAGAWLLRVARNRIIDLFRRKKELHYDSMTSADIEQHVPQLEFQLPAPETPDAAYARAIALDELQAAIDDLPSDQRAVFVGHEIDGVSFKELASRRGLSINTLIARKRYAVLKLRSRLQTVYDEMDT